MTQLTRKEKEKLVLELHKEGRTYAQIAKEAHVSLRDIGPILIKTGIQENQSVKSRGLELYSQQKNPLEVAIILGLEADEAIRLHREYFKLLGCSEFARVYPEIKDDPWSYVELVNLTKKQQISLDGVKKFLKIANSDIPSVEQRNQELERKESFLISNCQHVTRNLNELNDRKSKEKEALEQIRSDSNQLKEEIKNLRIEKMRLGNAMASFKTDNETSIRIKVIVRQEIEGIQSDTRRLLRCALASLFESESKQPGKLRALYYNKPTTLSIDRILSLGQIERYPGQYGSDEDSLEKLLLDEAELVLNRIVESLANMCINEITNDTPRLQLPNMLPVNEGRSTAINVFTNDVESLYQEASVSNILPSPSLHEDHHMSPNLSADTISISEIYINWANEYIKSLDKQQSGTAAQGVELDTYNSPDTQET